MRIGRLAMFMYSSVMIILGLTGILDFETAVFLTMTGMIGMILNIDDRRK